MVASNLDSDSWSEYWSKGFSSSFAGDEYSGAIADHWRSTLGGIPDGAAVLDLCCGNGSIFRLLDKADQRRLKLHGVDYAKLPLSKDDSFILQGGVNIEDLPFESGSFDMVISQFGVEYANVDAAFAEAERVLKPSRNISFICHHPDSVILQSNRVIYKCGEELINQAIPKLRHMCRGIDLIERGNPLGKPLADQYRERFNAVMDGLLRRYSQSLYDTGFPEALRKILQGKRNADCSARLEAFTSVFCQAQKRLELLFVAADNAVSIKADQFAEGFKLKKFVDSDSRLLGSLVAS